MAKLPFCINLQYTSKIAENIKGRISGRVKGQQKINYPVGSRFNLVKTKIVPAAATLFFFFFWPVTRKQTKGHSGYYDGKAQNIQSIHSLINENQCFGKEARGLIFLICKRLPRCEERTGSSSGEHPSLKYYPLNPPSSGAMHLTNAER